MNKPTDSQIRQEIESLAIAMESWPEQRVLAVGQDGSARWLEDRPGRKRELGRLSAAAAASLFLNAR